MKHFEIWLRAECFQKPTPEAYELAKAAYKFALDEAVKVAYDMYLSSSLIDCRDIGDKIKELKE